MRNDSSSFPYVSFSIFVHSGIALALLVVPHLKPLPFGSEGLVVEIDALPPQGEQMVTMDPSDKEKAVKELPAKAKVATALPPKQDIPEVIEESPVIDDSEMVAVAPVATPKVETVETEEVPEEIQEAQPLAEAPPVTEEREEEPLSAEELQQTANPEPVAPTQAQVSPEPASPAVARGAYGTSEGIRSYEDLKQLPGNRYPLYPEQSRLRHQEGQVVLKYFVTSEGRVSNLNLLKSSGYPLLDQEAVRSISQFRYSPGQQGWTLHPVNFNLKGPEQSVGGRLRTSMR